MVVHKDNEASNSFQFRSMTISFPYLVDEKLAIATFFFEFLGKSVVRNTITS